MFRTLLPSLLATASLLLAPLAAADQITDNARAVWRDWAVDGVPSSGAWNPHKGDIRTWGALIGSSVSALQAAQTGAALAFDTKANLDASLNYPANTQAFVYGDGTSANNGIYTKSGASGAGSWSKLSSLVYGPTPTFALGTVTVTGCNTDPAASLGGATLAPVLNLSFPSCNYTGAIPLPTPDASTRGGVYSVSAPAHEFLNGLDNTGHFTAAQPGVADIAGLGTGVATALGNAVNSSGGVLTGAFPSQENLWPARQIFGGSYTWFSLYNFDTNANILVANAHGTPGIIAGMRSSDWDGVSGSLPITSAHLCVHDSTSVSWPVNRSVWCNYDQTVRVPGAAPNIVLSHEISVWNQDSTANVDVDPYNDNIAKTTAGPRIDCGIGSGTAYDCTVALHIITNGGKFRKGIVFGNGSIVGAPTTQSPIISMPQNYSIDWWSPTGLAWRLFSDATTAGSRTLELNDNGLTVNGGNIKANGVIVNTGYQLLLPNNSFVAAKNFAGSAYIDLIGVDPSDNIDIGYGSSSVVQIYGGGVDLYAGIAQTGAVTPVMRSLFAQPVSVAVVNYFAPDPVAGPQFSNVFTVTGAATGSSYKVALYAAAQTGAGADEVYALNSVTQRNAATTSYLQVAHEADLNNNDADCVAVGIGNNCILGFSAISGGAHKPMEALLIYATAGATNQFVRGISIIANSTGIALDINGPSTLTGDVIVTQGANGKNSLVLQRATDTGPTGKLLSLLTTTGGDIFYVNAAGAALLTGGSATGNGAFIQLGGYLANELGLTIGRTNLTSGNVVLQGIQNGVGAAALQLNPAGGTVIVSGDLSAPGLPTVGGTIKGTPCVDTTGLIYVKTTPGACL